MVQILRIGSSSAQVARAIVQRRNRGFCSAPELLSAKIYQANQLLAKQSHAQFNAQNRALPDVIPLNIEPAELPIIRANTERNLAFRPLLISRLRRQQAQRAAYERRFSEAYARHYQEWLQNVEQQSGSKRRRALDRKLRLEFGRTFKVLGKGRGQGDQGQGHQYSNGLKRVIQGAAILPDILYGKMAPPRFDNRNGLLADPLQVLRQSALRSPVILWTAEEKATFRRKHLQKPKNFGYIAACLDGSKSVADCVAYYYASKRKEKYKEQVLANLRELSKKKMMMKKKKSTSTSKQRKRK